MSIDWPLWSGYKSLVVQGPYNGSPSGRPRYTDGDIEVSLALENTETTVDLIRKSFRFFSLTYAGLTRGHGFVCSLRATDQKIVTKNITYGGEFRSPVAE